MDADSRNKPRRVGTGNPLFMLLFASNLATDANLAKRLAIAALCVARSDCDGREVAGDQQGAFAPSMPPEKN